MTPPRFDLVGRSADRRTLVVRERVRRRAGGVVQTAFVYRAVENAREADPSAGRPLGRTGEPGLRAALARVLGEEGAGAALADEARVLLGGG